MSTTNITVRHRPTRIGLLVRPGKLGDVERAARICTLLWGGIHNPIIPVSTNDANARLLVRQFQVVVLFAVAESDAIKGFLQSYPCLLDPRFCLHGDRGSAENRRQFRRQPHQCRAQRRLAAVTEAPDRRRIAANIKLPHLYFAPITIAQ